MTTTTNEGQGVTTPGRSSEPPVPRWSPPSDPQVGTDVASLMRELQDRSRALDRASNELFRLTKEFEGSEQVDEDGVIAWVEGPLLRFEVAVAEEADKIADEYEDAKKRVPGVERLESKAKLRVRRDQPDLWAEYHILKTQVDAMKKWISARKETLSARQSVLSAEKAIING